MIKNYFVTALRSFWRNKAFTAINILSLAIGISAALVIYLIVHYEYSFDKFEKDAGHIYRVVNVMHFPDQEFKNSGVAFPLPVALRKEVTGIEESSHFIVWEEANVSIPIVNSVPKVYRKQPNIIFADGHYFNLFNYDWIAGSPENFRSAGEVVLTESRAKAYFSYSNSADIIGQLITYNDSTIVTVAGVVKDLNEITDFTFKEFISLATLTSSGLKNDYAIDEWGSITSSSQCFVKLSPAAAPGNIEKQLASLLMKHQEKDKSDMHYLLQPLSDLHFSKDYDNFQQHQADQAVLSGLMVVAFFLLLLGCINFINLNTAQATYRAKEIGIRKTMGGSKSQLIFQFLSETLVLTLLSTMLSLLLTPWLLKVFSDFIPPAINFSTVTEPHVIIFLSLLIIIVSVLAGFYPALVLSGFQPVTVLKNQIGINSGKTGKAWLRKSLTVTQFAGAQFFIIATILVGKQIHYSLTKDLGFRKDAIVYMGIPYHDKAKSGVLLNKLKSIPEIEKACLAGPPPASSGVTMQTMAFEQDGKKTESTVQLKYGDDEFFNLYGMKLLAGNYPQPSDTLREFIINETYAKLLGFRHPQEAIGKMIEHNKPVPIVGVVRDFNSSSTKNIIGPVACSANASNYNCFHVLLKSPKDEAKTWQSAISKMETAWKEVYPDQDFNYHFFDESIAAFYKNEENISKLLSWATGLAVLISCLGLFGLAIYTTNQRTREIGVRKVLGATVGQIMLLLSRDFLALLLIAFVVAVPLAWWVMQQWLENFAYHTALNWWIFAGGGTIMLCVALTILCIRTAKAASANPVKSLRVE